MITIKQLSEEISDFLNFDDYGQDISMNGLQICGEPSREVEKAAFAVDASLSTLQAAAREGADILFVHHGLFWGHPLAVTGCHYERLKAAIMSGISLFASHIPLDAHPEVGNNAQIAKRLGLVNVEPFARWRGMSIGFKGILPEPLSSGEVVDRLGVRTNPHIALILAGSKKNRSVAIVSGGAAEDLEDAIAQGVDCYITGESSHQVYNTCIESGINMLSLGHYETETFGVKALMEHIRKRYGIDTVFLDFPTTL